MSCHLVYMHNFFFMYYVFGALVCIKTGTCGIRLLPFKWSTITVYFMIIFGASFSKLLQMNALDNALPERGLHCGLNFERHRDVSCRIYNRLHVLSFCL